VTPTYVYLGYLSLLGLLTMAYVVGRLDGPTLRGGPRGWAGFVLLFGLAAFAVAVTQAQAYDHGERDGFRRGAAAGAAYFKKLRSGEITR
jgi:hypothetical protein